MLVNQNQPLGLFQIFSLLTESQIKLIKRELVKYVLHGKLIHQRHKETRKIQEILWNLIRKLPLIIKLQLRIITNIDKIMTLEFHLVYQHWRRIEVFLYQWMDFPTEELIDLKLLLAVLYQIVLEKLQDKFCKLDTEISRISRNKLVQKDKLRLDTLTLKWRPRNSLKQRIHSIGNKIPHSNSS